MKYDFAGIVFHEIIIMKFMSIHPIEYKIRSLARCVQAAQREACVRYTTVVIIWMRFALCVSCRWLPACWWMVCGGCDPGAHARYCREVFPTIWLLWSTYLSLSSATISHGVAGTWPL